MKKINFKKIASLLIAFALIFTIAMPQGLFTAKAADAKTFDIIEITDFHGTLLSSDAKPLPVGAVLAKNIKDIKGKNPDTVVIGGGDLYQGSPLSNVLRGVPVRDTMNSIGMEVTALGNHEFDWGIDTIKDTTMKGANYSIVCANLYDKKTGKRAFDPYKVITKDGVRIAFIGAITKDTPSIVTPANVADYKFTDAAEEINSVAKQIKDEKLADVIIAVMHAGSMDGKTGEAFDIANKLVGVDAVFGGHTHTKVYASAANGIPVYVGNYNGKGFIDAKMTVSADGKVSFPAPSASDYVALDNTNANGYKAENPVEDPDVKKIVDAANAELGPKFSVVIGETSKDLTRTQSGSPYGESQLGNWVSDVTKEKADADVGVGNNGGIRVDISKGNITVGQIFSLMPFDNEINYVTMTKQQLKAALEQAVMDGGKGLQVSGIKFTYDMSRPSGDRVTSIVREDGKVITDSEKLKVAGSDFVLSGGDGFTAFADKAVTSTLVNTHVLVRDALIEDVNKNSKDLTAAIVMDSRLTNETTKTANTISIVATSDVHGSVYPIDYFKNAYADQGLAKVSTYVSELRKKNPNTMLVDNGDTIQGTPLVYYYNMIDTKSVYPMMKVMGAMGYDTWSFGNHEFNFGLYTLNRIIADARANNIHVISANIYKDDNTNFVDPYYIKSFNINGKMIKVGILGLTTKCVPNWEDPKHYAGLHFNDLVDEAKKWVPKMRADGADYVILTAHSGEESASDTIPENEIKAIAQNVSGIDAIVAGHTHALIPSHAYTNPDGKFVYVTEPKNNASFISQIDINLDDKGNLTGIVTKNVPMDKNIAADTNITDTVAKQYEDVTLEYLKTILGESTGEYTGKGITEGPTALMDLVNIVQMDAAGTQLSIAAPLSVTAVIPKGDVTIQDISSVYIYENFLYGIKMNGKQIKDWLEWSARYYKQVSGSDEKPVKDPVLNVPDYNLDMLYGATYDIDLTEPAGSRIKNLKYEGKLIKDTDVFTVAINNYRFNGGGGFMAAAGLKPGDMSIVTYDSAKLLGDDGQVRSLMMKYVKDHKTITPTVADNWKTSTTKVAAETEKPSVPNTPVPAQSAKVISIIAKSGLRIRAAAGVKSSILGVLRYGTKVNVIGESGHWYRIQYAKITGYVFKAYTK